MVSGVKLGCIASWVGSDKQEQFGNCARVWFVRLLLAISIVSDFGLHNDSLLFVHLVLYLSFKLLHFYVSFDHLLVAVVLLLFLGFNKFRGILTDCNCDSLSKYHLKFFYFIFGK